MSVLPAFTRWPLPPLGVQLADGGVDVAVFASHATGIDFCALDESGEERRFPLTHAMHGIWSAHVDGIGPGQHYGFRAHGAWDPDKGLRYNPHKLLVDPYARAITGDYQAVPAVYGQVTSAAGQPMSREMDTQDSALFVPHSVVTAQPPQYQRAPKPRINWDEMVVYEAHVKGLTIGLEGVPAHLRGTYAGLAHPATIGHLKSLGVTSLELLPIHSFLDEPALRRAGRANYWGYNTLGFFAPHEAYATAQSRRIGPHAVIDELRGAVDLLHRAGIEVILDVVYNHTCEAGADGPHLSFRGLDNTKYYLHDGSSPARYLDVTGCGNTVDFRRRRVVQLALDSLRYWTDVIGVDGFRFDLAVTLGRGPYGFDPNHPFFVALISDPILSGAKLIAEPWDIGPGGWQTGRFPIPFAEWNDKFRNAVRTFWLSDAAEAAHGRSGHGLRELATRLAGSADLFGMSDPPFMRGTAASVNYVTAHDGFTLADLVSYNHKHNVDNGEDNRDGSDDNRSWNHGMEGPVEDPEMGAEIVGLRLRSMRNLMATLLLSAGTPMIVAGDEIGRTQGGNNNAYTQDNEVSWVDWNLSLWQRHLLDTSKFLLALRRKHPSLRSARFFTGRPITDDGPRDLAWFGWHGHELSHDEWNDPATHHLQMMRITDDDITLVAFNGSLEPTVFVLPDGRDWTLVWDSAWEYPGDEVLNGDEVGTSELVPLSIKVFTA